MSKGSILAVVTLIGSFMLFTDANAQMMQGQKEDHNMRCGMMGEMMGQGMQGGMMRGMMDQGMQSMHGGFGFYLNRAEELGLTQQQIEQLRNLKFEFEKANVQRQAALQTARLELQQLKSADNVDAKKVEAKIREIQNREADLEVATFQAQVRAKEVLTAEQKAKLKDMACPMCGEMHGDGMMMKGGMMQRGMMMQQKQEDENSSSHEQHHQKN